MSGNSTLSVRAMGGHNKIPYPHSNTPGLKSIFIWCTRPLKTRTTIWNASLLYLFSRIKRPTKGLDLYTDCSSPSQPTAIACSHIGFFFPCSCWIYHKDSSITKISKLSNCQLFLLFGLDSLKKNNKYLWNLNEKVSVNTVKI